MPVEVSLTSNSSLLVVRLTSFLYNKNIGVSKERRNIYD